MPGFVFSVPSFQCRRAEVRHVKPAALNAAGSRCYCSRLLLPQFPMTVQWICSSQFSNASISHRFLTISDKIVEPVPAHISVLRDVNVGEAGLYVHRIPAKL